LHGSGAGPGPGRPGAGPAGEQSRARLGRRLARGGRGQGSGPVPHTTGREPRPTGEDGQIDGDDQVTRPRFGRPPGDPGTLVPGQHLCALYQDQDERQRLTAAVVRGALAAGDRIVYLAPGPQDGALALLEAGGIETGRPLRGGQLLVHSFGEVYGDPATMDLARLVAAFRLALSQSLAAGFPGLRITGEMGGHPGPDRSLERLVHWERMMSQMLAEVGIAAICQYDQRQLDKPAAATIAAEHTGVATGGQRPPPLALFIASAPPPALWVEGELDLTNGNALARVLRARVAVGPRQRVDLGAVTFADVGSLREIYQIAAGLPAGGRITLANATEPVRRVLDLAGFRTRAMVIES
jgi:MEDS: MEthanogen/methylotroph, DcmR Sensory domain/STAS domain